MHFANIACNETDKDADSVVKSVSAMLTYNDVTVSVSELIGAGSSAVDVLKKQPAGQGNPGFTRSVF